MRDVKKISASRRRKLLIIFAAVAVVLLAIAIAYVMDYVKTITYEDPADEAKYYIRLTDGEYKLYYRNKKDVLPMTDDGEYYITDAGTLVRLMADTGEYYTMAVVDESYGEVTQSSTSILALPHRNMASIRSIEVHNPTGTFTIQRYDYVNGRYDDSVDFTIKGYPLVSIDQLGISSISVAAGRLLANRKFVSPDVLTDEQKANFEKYEHLTYVTEEDGTLDESEYGLVAEKRQRLNEETGEMEEYDYTPSYFIVTTTADDNGNCTKYKVIIGDRLVNGEGYYMQVVEYKSSGQETRDVVYVSPSSLGVSMLERIESFATATLSYPMTVTTYLDVKNFNLFKGDSDTPSVAFSFIPLDDRENTAYSGNAYRFHHGLEGYAPATTVIAQCLEGIYQPSLVDIKKLFNAESNMDPLVEYGFYDEIKNDKGEVVDYELSYDYMIAFDYKTEEYGTIRQMIMITNAPNGNYYAYTTVHDPSDNSLLYSYNMIVEVSAYSFYFLTMEEHHWVEQEFFKSGITFVDKLTFKSPDFSAEIILDNSASDPNEELDSSNLVIKGTMTDSDGETNIQSMYELRFLDKNNIIWVINDRNVRAFNTNSEEISIQESSWYQTTNLRGDKVKALHGYIECYDASGRAKIVKVDADTVSVKDVATQTTEVYVRCGTMQLKSLYRHLMLSRIESSYEMTEEEEAALIGNEENWMFTFTARIDGENVEYSFYRLSPRKVYITVNGNGGFYVHINTAKNILADVQKLFNGEFIEF